jgi:hypothetical protein
LKEKNKTKTAHQKYYDRSRLLASFRPTGSIHDINRSPASGDLYSPLGRHHGNSTSPRQQRLSRTEERIHKLINELRTDPLLWQKFQQQVEKYQETKKLQLDVRFYCNLTHIILT